MIRIDPEFQALCPPLTEDEFNGLKKDIEARGCLDAVKVWNGILVDGHNRFMICNDKVITFQISEMDFPSRDAAKIWIIQNQFSRRNLSPFQRAELVMKLEPLIAVKAKERQAQGGKEKVVQTFAQAPDESKTRALTAGLANISSETYRKAKTISEKAPETTKAALRNGTTTINKVFTDIHRAERRTQAVEAVKEAAKLPDTKYRVIYADPPWQYGDAGYGSGPAEFHYPTMNLRQICDLPISEMAAESSVLFLWATSPMLPEALQVVESWGFIYKASFIWNKIKHNVGHYNSVRHEFLLIATRGGCLPDCSQLPPSVVSIERGEHSVKPEEFRKIIDSMYPHGKRVELFARKKTEGWDVWGNQA